jgi:hypothetical protein
MYVSDVTGLAAASTGEKETVERESFTRYGTDLLARIRP